MLVKPYLCESGGFLKPTIFRMLPDGTPIVARNTDLEGLEISIIAGLCLLVSFWFVQK